MIKGWHVNYDPIGNRVSRTYNGAETRYVVDPSSVVLAETDGQGNITAYYVYGLGLISKITPQGDGYYYHYDALDSTVAMTDAAGAVVNKYAYGIFGQVIDEEEQVENPFKYVGAFGVMDEENGLYFMRARYYNPEAGRFISKDPIGFAGGINMYAYVGGNPLNAIDPLGLLDNPFPRLPSFSDAFPCSDTVAPVADIIVGGIEGGFAVVLGTASVVSIAAGPGMWWVPILYGGIAVDTGWDSYNRLKSAIDRLNNRNYACNGDKARCQ